LSVGDIVKDINTNTQGEVIAISKMHHEADIDIVVRWEQPINGQTTFEVHPNEIKFVRHKTEPEVMEDVDWRYYEESIKENKGLKTRLDYGIRRQAGQFYQPGQFQLVWDNYTPGLDYYRALGHIQTEDKVMYWAVDNDTASGQLQLIDPEDINDGLVDFRTIVKEEYENASEMINEATQMILEVSNARFERVKTSPPSEPRPKRHKPGEAKEEAFEEEEGIGEGAGEAAGTERTPDNTPLPAGAPTEREPHLNGYLANDEGSCALPFWKAYAVWIIPLKRWQIMVLPRKPTPENPMDYYALEVEDYLNRRSLCQPEQPST
jgi:Arc/MetJ-type ribon-helix-helix transcriptional regulator